MVGVGTTEAGRQLAANFAAVSSASEGVFLYYKFGRHAGVFSEKPYFLLSHCTHVLFTLWRFEEDQGSALFHDQPRPTASLSGLNFGSLRYEDYKRRMLHADLPEDNWKNETQWFEFWMQILEQWDPSGEAVYREFSRCILACMKHSEVLESKEAHRNHSTFDRFMRTDAAGSVMSRTLAVLDEVMRGIMLCLAGLDPTTHFLERILVLAALLSETRRIVIYQTPAKGPYTPLGATRWRAPSPLSRLFWGRTQGVLTVVPRREGGDIVCTYDSPPQPKNRRRSWTRPVSSLTGTYEQELFATWPYETGVCRDDSGHPSDVTARWTLQNAEATRLEIISRWIDALLEGLSDDPAHEPLVAEIVSVSRNGSARWKAADVPWTYIHQLDELLSKLKEVLREANVQKRKDAAERILAGAWSAPQAQDGETDSRGCEEQETCAVQDQPAVVETPQILEPPQCDVGADESQSEIVHALEELSALCLSAQNGPAIPAEPCGQQSRDERRNCLSQPPSKGPDGGTASH